MKEKGYTIKSLADKIGVNRVSLTNSINGNPTMDTLMNIANALDVDITELFARPKTSDLMCPNCGAKLEIRLKEDPVPLQENE